MVSERQMLNPSPKCDIEAGKQSSIFGITYGWRTRSVFEVVSVVEVDDLTM
jgi:hypothetical protein